MIGTQMYHELETEMIMKKQTTKILMDAHKHTHTQIYMMRDYGD